MLRALSKSVAALPTFRRNLTFASFHTSRSLFTKKTKNDGDAVTISIDAFARRTPKVIAGDAQVSIQKKKAITTHKTSATTTATTTTATVDLKATLHTKKKAKSTTASIKRKATKKKTTKKRTATKKKTTSIASIETGATTAAADMTTATTETPIDLSETTVEREYVPRQIDLSGVDEQTLEFLQKQNMAFMATGKRSALLQEAEDTPNEIREIKTKQKQKALKSSKRAAREQKLSEREQQCEQEPEYEHEAEGVFESDRPLVPKALAMPVSYSGKASVQHSYYVDSYQGDLMTVEDYLEILREHKGQDIAVIDLREKCHFAHYMIFVTGQSARHMRVMAKSIVRELMDREISGLSPAVEGEECDDWMLVDGGNTIVQIFSAKGRAYYDLERKWAFQKVEQFEGLLALQKQINSGKTSITIDANDSAYTAEEQFRSGGIVSLPSANVTIEPLRLGKKAQRAVKHGLKNMRKLQRKQQPQPQPQHEEEESESQERVPIEQLYSEKRIDDVIESVAADYTPRDYFKA